MFDKDKWQEIYQTLSKNKLRTFLTAFGVFWGIFMLLIMLGAGNGLQNGVMRGFSNWATNSIFFWTTGTTMEYKGFAPGRQIAITNEDIKGLKDFIPEIDKLAPQHRMGNKELKNGTKMTSVMANGEYPDYAFINVFQMKSGRFINEMDIKNQRKVIIISARTQEILFVEGQDPIGKDLQIDGINFKIIGVIKPSERNNNRQMEEIIIPFTTLQSTFNLGNTVGSFIMTVFPEANSAEVEQKVLKYIKEKHQVHPEDKQAIGSFSMEKEFKKIQALFFAIKAISWFVGGFTLLAGMIGISNIMLIVIRERTKELGIRRAIGATPRAIVSQIITESLVLTFLAGYFGLMLGIFLLELVSKLLRDSGQNNGMFYNPGVDLRVAVTAFVILIISGMLAGLIPAYKAIKIKPVEALRTE
jgi:putative ABC transport system permease protein